MKRLFKSILLSFAFAFLGNTFSFSQVDTTKKEDNNLIDNFIEDATIDTQNDGEVDWTVFTDALELYKKKPLNLNTATKEELLLIPGMTELLVANLQNYIRQFGKLTSLYELQAVPGFDATIFYAIRPFVTVVEVSATDIQDRPKHPHGPSFRKVLTESTHEILLRTTRIVEEQRGYTPPDTNSDGSLSSRYLGDANRFYTRYRMRYAQNFSLAIVGEKDPGEAFKWNPATQSYGFDFLAGHIALRNYGRLKSLVIGDYNIQSGQGLILSTGIGFGKGAESVNAVKRTNFGIRPYSSVNENQFMRGAAATVAFGDIYVTAFGSRVSVDANITLADTTTNEIEEVSSLQTSGFHRTPSELEDKGSLLETTAGARVEYKISRLSVGTSHLYQHFSGALAPSGRDYQLFNFSGKQNLLNGLDFDWTYRNFNFFGELARSLEGGTAMTTGLMASLNPKMDIALQFRNFDRDFHGTNRAYAFAELPTAVQNERGLYLGTKIYPSPKLTISAYMDQYWFPWNRYNVSFPSHGIEYFVDVAYKPSRSLGFSVRYKSDNKETNAREFPVGQQIEYLIPTQRQNLRFQYDQKFHRSLGTRTRVELSHFTRGDEGASKGILLYQDLSWEIRQGIKFTGRYAIFDIQDYDARIYAYENEILGYFSIPGYYGKGTRYYGILQLSPNKTVDIWLRYSRTRLPGEKTQGSGLSEIQGETRSEVKAQVRFTF